MMLEETLVKFGLEQKEAKIYLAALELGPSSVLQISKKAAVKRPTTYVILDSLIEKGYISKTQKHGRVMFTAEKPEVLLRAIRAKEEVLHEALPMFEAIMASAKERPKISIHEGREAIHRVYSEIYANPEIWWLGSVKDINQYFADEIKEMIRVSKQKQPRVHDIITSHPDDLAYGRAVASETHEVRVIPQELNLSIDTSIFGNKIAIFSIKKEFFAVVIESKDVADSFRTIHALAWQSATPVE